MAIRQRKGRKKPWEVYWNNPFTLKRESLYVETEEEAKKQDALKKFQLKYERDFFRREEAEAPQDDPYQRLRFAVSLETDLPLIPNWAPEGTVSDGEISVIERSNGIRLQGTYKTDNASFSIRVVLYNVLPEEYASIYQKSDETMIEYSAGNIMHYLMNNNEIYSVTWVNENAEVLIQGNLSIADLEKMVDSIY